MGTSPKECFLSGLLAAVDKKKILHLDRNAFYGGECTSYNLQNLWQKHHGETKINPALLSGAPGRPAARSSDYSIDAAPKFLMGSEPLVDCLRKMIPEDYMTYTKIAGSYVYMSRSLHKVPTTAQEGLSSSLLGMMQKVRFRSFINYVDGYDEKDTSTHDGYNLKQMTMAQMYSQFSLDETSQIFISHALALQTDEAHLQQPAINIVKRIKLYAYSMVRFQDATSPYIYPLYGLGNISESFSRLSSIYGSRYITDCEIKSLNWDADGKFTGITFSQAQCGEVTATAKQIVGDPSYFPESKTRKVNQICRSICVLSSPVPQASSDCQIILPGKNIAPARKSDIYVSCLCSQQKVCPDGKYLAVVSTTNNGADCDVNDLKACKATNQRELKAALELFKAADNKTSSIIESFDWVTNERIPVDDGKAKGYFITRSFDATTHFQSVMDEVFGVYTAVTGKVFNLNELKSIKEIQAEEEEKAKQMRENEPRPPANESD